MKPLILLSLILLLGCEAEKTLEPTVTGLWIGYAVFEPKGQAIDSIQVNLGLTEEDQVITGIGNYSGAVYSMEIFGYRDADSIHIEFYDWLGGSSNFDGVFAGQIIEGTTDYDFGGYYRQGTFRLEKHGNNPTP